MKPNRDLLKKIEELEVKYAASGVTSPEAEQRLASLRQKKSQILALERADASQGLSGMGNPELGPAVATLGAGLAFGALVLIGLSVASEF